MTATKRRRKEVCYFSPPEKVYAELCLHFTHNNDKDIAKPKVPTLPEESPPSAALKSPEKVLTATKSHDVDVVAPLSTEPQKKDDSNKTSATISAKKKRKKETPKKDATEVLAVSKSHDMDVVAPVSTLPQNKDDSNKISATVSAKKKHKKETAKKDATEGTLKSPEKVLAVAKSHDVDVVAPVSTEPQKKDDSNKISTTIPAKKKGKKEAAKKDATEATLKSPEKVLAVAKSHDVDVEAPVSTEPQKKDDSNKISTTVSAKKKHKKESPMKAPTEEGVASGGKKRKSTGKKASNGEGDKKAKQKPTASTKAKKEKGAK